MSFCVEEICTNQFTWNEVNVFWHHRVIENVCHTRLVLIVQKFSLFQHSGVDSGRSQRQFIHLNQIMSLWQLSACPSQSDNEIWAEQCSQLKTLSFNWDTARDTLKQKYLGFTISSGFLVSTWWLGCLGYKPDGANWCRWFLIQKCAEISTWVKWQVDNSPRSDFSITFTSLFS